MADNDIIDFYKKADTDNKPEEPLKEQVETPEPVVSEAVAVPVPESNDPFDKFLFNLAEKLKTEKKITEQQQQQFNERIVQPTTNPEDPFAKFLESFAGLVKEDENINKEENIKEATIDFINKLKNDDFFDREVPKVKQVKSKSKKYLPPKFAKKVEKIEEEQPVIEQSTEPESQQEDKQPEQTNNPYLKELQTADKKKNKIEDKISGLSDIKKIIAQQVQEQLSKYPNLGFTGGGGGTNAVQYAEGGTMNGDLNVTGKYLSGGVDISTLFGSGGGAVSGIPDRLIAGSETLRLYSDGTIDFPNDTIRPPDETILTLESENPLLSSYVRVALSPYAFFAYDNEGNSITFDQVDNAIVLTSQNEHEWTFNKQGVLAGPHNYLTVNALSSLGRILSGGKDLLEIFALSGQGGGGGTGRDDVNTIVISNSANWDIAYNIATAYQSVSSSFATNSLVNNVSSLLTPLALTNTLTGQLITNTTFANYQTSVAGTTATLLPTSIYQSASGNWQTAYTNLVSNSAAYLSGVDLTFLQEPSANWNSTYTTVQSNSSNWQNAYNTVTVYQSNSSSYATTAYTDATYLPLSGGTLTGNLSVYGSTFINNNLTIGGSLTALGTATFANTVFTTTSALSVYNTGPGPALYVYQAAGPYDVASFYDGDGIEVLHVGNAGPGGLGKVGVNESFPNEELTVRGSISATEVIYAENGNSTSWNTAYQNVSSQSLNTTDNVEFNLVKVTGGAGSRFVVGNDNIIISNDIGESYIASDTGYTISLETGTLGTTTYRWLINASQIDTNQINATTYLSAGVNLLDIFSGGGGGATPIKRFDYVTVANIDYSYSGTAPFGTLDNNPIWKLIRLTYANNGTISNQASALNSWTGRLTASYITI